MQKINKLRRQLAKAQLSLTTIQAEGLNGEAEERRTIAMLEEKIRNYEEEEKQGREKPQSMPRTPQGRRDFWEKFNPNNWQK